MEGEESLVLGMKVEPVESAVSHMPGISKFLQVTAGKAACITINSINKKKRTKGCKKSAN